MGAAASTIQVDKLPALIDKPTAQRFAGDKYDDVAFDTAQSDGCVTREAFIKAVGLGDDNVTQKRKWNAQAAESAMAAAALSLVHDKRSNFLGAEVKDKTSVEETFINAWQASAPLLTSCWDRCAELCPCNQRPASRL